MKMAVLRANRFFMKRESMVGSFFELRLTYILQGRMRV